MELNRIELNRIINKALSRDNGLSYSNDLDEEGYNVYNLILEHKYTEGELFETNQDYKRYQMKFKRIFRGIEMNYIVNYYDIGDEVRRNLPCMSYVLDEKTVFITVNYEWENCLISIGDLHDKIQCELINVINEIDYNKIKKFKREDNESEWIIKTFYKSSNKYKRIIGSIFYKELEDTQNDYESELYTEIKENLYHHSHSKEFIKQTTLFKRIEELFYIKENLAEYFSNDDFINVIEEFKHEINYSKPLTIETLINKIDYKIKRLFVRVFIVIRMYKKYLIRSGMTRYIHNVNKMMCDIFLI